MKLPHRNKAFFLIWIMVVQTLAPIPGYALSGGNKAPEFESFQPFGLDNMVDPSTGDFSYNIPLMNVGFHGINLFYQAGITMDQEATMVGLGWNINSGMINRTIRGIPDDFKGDLISKEMYTKPNVTVGLKTGLDFELAGTEMFKLGASLGVSVNSLNGIGFDWSISPSFSATKSNQTGLTAGLGLSSSTHGGVSLSPNVGYKIIAKNKIDNNTNKMTFGIGTSINSRGGLKGLSLSSSIGTAEKPRISIPAFSASYSFAKPSFIPYVDFPTKNTAFALNISGGVAGFTTEVGMFGMGYFSKQEYETNTLDLPSFGLLYPSFNTNGLGLNDFHRSNDMPQSEDIPNLATPQLDFDIYTVAGPGLSGSLQLKRGDFGVVSDRRSFSNSNDNTIGVELGAGAFTHIGGDITSISSTNVTQAWNLDNELNTPFDFNDEKFKLNYENAFLRKADEILVEKITTGDKFSKIGGKDILKPDFTKIAGLDYKANSNLKSLNNTSFDFYNLDVSDISERNKRKNNIQYLSFAEAEKFGFSKYIRSSNGAESIYEYLNNHDISEPHHIAEIIVDNEDGYKYHYGLPVYNVTQVEATFAVDSNDVDQKLAYNKGLVNYHSGSDQMGNDNGTDEFYTKTIIPPYVSSYLLTAIVSNDYQDIGGDGPTPDDYGDYVRFDYDKMDGIYKWRTPHTLNEHSGSLNRGLLTDRGDDKANYVYGERQQYFPKSISNKSEIAIYDYYQNREDALPALGHQGGVNLTAVNQNKALKSITKYSLPDYMMKGVHGEPLKSTFFEYSYDLCKNVVNSASGLGKLTLEKLYILNGRSNKGRLSPYVFDYGNVQDTLVNPNYHPKSVNRWAGFQPVNLASNTYDDTNHDKYDGDLLTTDFPYVPQDQKELQDLYASAWNLKSIQMPSGGLINVEYEADDYAYIQNRRAMQMFEIAYTGDGSTMNSDGTLYSGNNKFYNLYFEIKDQEILSQLDGTNSFSDKDVLQNQYIRDIEGKLLYYKVFGNFFYGGERHEYVPGWTKIVDYGTKTHNGKILGYVELKPACIKDRKSSNCNNNKKINPISKSIMQAIRLNYPDAVWGAPNEDPDSSPSNAESAIMALTSTLTQIPTFVTGPNFKMKNQGFGSKIKIGKSFIRLYNPNKKKVSGTHRVRRIIMSDNWNLMTDSGFNGVFGKEYIYSETERINELEREISTGVAAYEPIVGGEENVFKNGIAFKEELLLAPDNTKYQEEPLLEDYYPSPQIKYSKVTVKDLYSPTQDINKLLVYEKTGYQENHFFTYKDYPIKAQKSGTEPKLASTPKVFKFLKINYEEHLTNGQGYLFIDPQMHGIPKANYVYNSASQLISGQEFEYLEDEKGQLDFEIDALHPDGEIHPSRMGIDYNVFMDSREATSTTITEGATGNTEGFPIAFIPGILILVLPKFAREVKQFRSLVVVKSIRQNGILKSTTSINGPARIKTENLVWDSETGNPIVTKTYNEFEDPIYQASLPSYLHYPRMGQSYQNASAQFQSVNCNNGIVNFNSGSHLDEGLTIGDKLCFDNSGNPELVWVLYKTTTQAYLIDELGNPVDFTNQDLKVLESGYNNKASSPIGSYTTLNENPIQTIGGAKKIVLENGILDASVTTYSENWQTYCAESELNEDQLIDCDLKLETRSYLNFLFEVMGNMDLEGGSGDMNAQGFGSLFPSYENCPYNQYYYNVDPNGCVINLTHGFAHCYCPTKIAFDPACIQNAPITNIQYDFNTVTIDPNNPGIIHLPNVIVTTQEGQFQTNITIESDCLEFISCKSETISSSSICDVGPGYIANPFIQNLRGQWRPHKNYVFQTDRLASNNIRVDGVYVKDNTNYSNKFINFWDENYLQQNTNKWTWTNENTIINPHGVELEAKDPLGRFSCEIPGYNQQKIIAVSANASLNEVAYSGFEQRLQNGIDISANQSFFDQFIYNPTTGQLSLNTSGKPIVLPCKSDVHFPFLEGSQIHFVSNEPNSGNLSLRLNQNETTIYEFEVSNRDCGPPQPYSFAPYVLEECDCVPKFSPSDDTRYLISAWLKDSRLDGINDDGAYLSVQIDGVESVVKEYGPLIDGWRKIEGVFEIPVGASLGKIQIKNTTLSCYLDDLRIHPYNASMKTYNYDQETLRFTYEHDDNNYYTKYDYAKDGTLKRISKQTEKGVQTLQESTFSQQKKIN